ncbi:MAG: hypothetical protein KDE26_07115 [Bacteroidetes bacterium]|nr:hypothetical protein [Bacteroidota bacterium]MCB0843016.1 hypothetical protein [Bacteroidota bacterium]
MKKLILSALMGLLVLPLSISAQQLTKVAVLNLDSKNLSIDPASLGNLARVELQKKSQFEVYDRYDMEALLSGDDFSWDNCYSKPCLVKAGELLKANKVLTGSAEKFGDKIVVILRFIDVSRNMVEKTNVREFIDVESELQKMMEVSINDLLGDPVDPILEGNLAYVSESSTLPPKKFLNNGPRVGFAFINGRTADRMMDDKAHGGYDILPFISQIGYQHEFQYMSSGNFQALVEVLVMASGLEQSMFIPNVVFMNGFRHQKSGFEIAFGPSIGMRKMEYGYFNTFKGEHEGIMLNGDGEWYLERDWDVMNEGIPVSNPNNIENQIDSRGDLQVFSRWIWAVGKTFRTGNLNMPVNVYGSILKRDYQVGLSVGFNVQRTKKK